jgi:uncharacterized membrane protein YhhN
LKFVSINAPPVNSGGAFFRLLIAALAIACIALVACQLTDVRLGAIASKFVASTAFLAIAILSGALRSRYGRVLFAGLVLSWFGDMFLLGTTRHFFLAGLVSFLLAHIAYVIAFSVHGLNAKWSIAAFLPVAALSILVAVWLTPYLPADMITPVRTYTFVISLMVVTAFGTKGAGGPWLIPLGATLFYFSDLSVAAGQFIEPAFPNYVWGLPFYYFGQTLLALSVRYLKS